METETARISFVGLPWARGQSAVVHALRVEASAARLVGDWEGAVYLGRVALRVELATAAQFEEMRELALLGV